MLFSALLLHFEVCSNILVDYERMHARAHTHNRHTHHYSVRFRCLMYFIFLDACLQRHTFICRTCGGIAYTEMRSHSMSREASFSKRGPKSAKTVGKQAGVSQNPEGFMSQTAGAKVKDRIAQIQQKNIARKCKPLSCSSLGYSRSTSRK